MAFELDNSTKGNFISDNPYGVNISNGMAYIRGGVVDSFNLSEHKTAHLHYDKENMLIGVELMPGELGKRKITKLNRGRQAHISVASTLKRMGISIFPHNILECTVEPWTDGRKGFIIVMPKQEIEEIMKGFSDGTPTPPAVSEHPAPAAAPAAMPDIGQLAPAPDAAGHQAPAVHGALPQLPDAAHDEAGVSGAPAQRVEEPKPYEPQWPHEMEPYRTGRE